MEHGSLSKSKDAKGREKGGMLAVDIEFLTTCMKHVIGGSIVVSLTYQRFMASTSTTSYSRISSLF
jgi:hypothetical protein